jgi:hypothetical protein
MKQCKITRQFALVIGSGATESVVERNRRKLSQYFALTSSFGMASVTTLGPAAYLRI